MQNRHLSEPTALLLACSADCIPHPRVAPAAPPPAAPTHHHQPATHPQAPIHHPPTGTHKHPPTCCTACVDTEKRPSALPVRGSSAKYWQHLGTPRSTAGRWQAGRGAGRGAGGQAGRRWELERAGAREGEQHWQHPTGGRQAAGWGGGVQEGGGAGWLGRQRGWIAVAAVHAAAARQPAHLCVSA